MEHEIREPARPVPVFLPPSIFDAAKALGLDLRGYRKTNLIPVEKDHRAYPTH